MIRTILKSKIHRATVTVADLEYEGSMTNDAELMDAADLLPPEKVDIYACTCLLYTSPSPRDATLPPMPSSA